MDKLRLYYNTIRYLKVQQISSRLFRKMGRKFFVDKKFPPKTMQVYPELYLDTLDGDKQYLQRFDIEGLVNNEVELLHEKHWLDLSNWSINGATTHLWLFNLQYMEYLVPLAIEYVNSKNESYYQKIKEYITSWMSCFSGIGGDAWEPYAISLRIPNWLIVMDLLKLRLEKDTEFVLMLSESIYRQYNYLKYSTETHLLGNHYFENLKCLIICSIIYDEKPEIKKYIKLFDEQLKEQILPDGMHYERSFMYHRIIMEDVLRIILILQQTDVESAFLSRCVNTFKKMCEVENGFEKDIKRTLLFNDAGDNVAKSATALLNSAKKLGLYNANRQSIAELPYAGYYKYESDRIKMIIDCGVIGPDYIPGHGHCDCLSYELFVDRVPILVNSGTYQYQDVKREYFRSTRAHNTIAVGNCEQSQCWGEHRVARRVHNIEVKKTKDIFSGQCTFWNGKRAKRDICINDNSIIITDGSKNAGDTYIESFIHFAPDCSVERVNATKYIIKSTQISKSIMLTVESGEVNYFKDKERFYYSEDFGQYVPIEAITIKCAGDSEIKYKVQW